jgi:hypothetical protein
MYVGFATASGSQPIGMLTPNNATVAEPEVRTAILLPPHGRVQGRAAVAMARDTPTWPLIGKKIHMQNRFASAGTNHRGLFLEAVFLDYVKLSSLQPLWQRFVDNNRRIRRYDPIM